MPATYRQAAHVRAYTMKFPTSARAAKIAAIRHCIAILAGMSPTLP